LMKLNAH